jgi:hypothetical protein
MQICTTKAQRHQERLRSSYPQISQKDADFEIQIGDIGVICGSLLPFLVSFRHWGGFKATYLGGENLPGICAPHFEVDGLLVFHRSAELNLRPVQARVVRRDFTFHWSLKRATRTMRECESTFDIEQLEPHLV